MQHDLVELIGAIEYARQNFSNDSCEKLWFIREDLVDGYGEAYRQDRCSFYGCQLHVVSRGTRIEASVIGLGNDVSYQRKFIADTIASHRNGTF